MKLVKKALAGVAVAAALATSAQATVINIDGIYWDPSAAVDLAATAGFYQWFQSSATTVDATTAATLSDTNSPVGRYLTGVGAITTLNAANNIAGTPNPETTPAQFAPNTQLTLAFGGIKVNSVNITNPAAPVYSLDLSQSFFTLYSDTSKNFDDASPVAANLNLAVDAGDIFLSGKFDAFSLSAFFATVGGTVGSILGGNTFGLMSATGGDALGNFDTNTQSNALIGVFGSDITMNGSAQFNLNPTGSISNVATLNLQGNTIPEPASIALIGLAMLGAGVASRRKSAKK